MDLAGVYVVVPAYNEATALPAVIENLGTVIARSQVVVVDDGSRDQTSATARRCGATVLRHPINRGQGAALATGIAAALSLGARCVVTFDADGQHRAENLPEMVEPILAGRCDVVLGSRFLGEGCPQLPPVRRLVLKLGVIFTMFMSRIRLTDTHNGFRAFSAEAAAKIRIRQDGMAHASEIIEEISMLRLRYLERPVRIMYTDYSLAKGQKSSAAVKLALRLIWQKMAG